MNQIPVRAACETGAFVEQNVHAYSSAFLTGTVTTQIQDRAGHPQRILVVDDDRDVRQLCADALLGAGYGVDTVEDAIAGWQALHACNYSLLLTDNKMPMVSGIEFIAKLRSARIDVPVVLVSSAILTEEVDQTPSLQLAATLLKPFTIAELLDTVKGVLRTGDCANRPGLSSPMLAADAHRISLIAQ